MQKDISNNTCVICDQPLTSNRFTDSTCSRKCYSLQWYRNNKRDNSPSVCEFCGKEYTPKHKNKHFCSVDCARAKHSTITFGKIICKECGKEFIKTHGSKIYCTDKCSVENGKRRRRECRKIFSLKILKCTTCGKDFKQTHHLQQYCSPECKTPKKIHSISCKFCGSIFETTQSNRRFCTKICNGRYKSKKNKSKSDRCKSIGHCECCGFSVIPALEAHHYSPTDLICICGNCHNIWHNTSDVKYASKDAVIAHIKAKSC